MKLAISNLAWDLKEDDEVKDLLVKLLITGVEIAPTKVWTNPLIVKNDDVSEYKNYWNSDGINVVALQSLLFGRPDLKIFQAQSNRQETLEYLTKIIEVGAKLGAKVFVFGSPKNRLIGNVTSTKAMDIAIDFFRKAGELAFKHSTTLCIEPNPEIYGCNFITNTEEGIKLVEEVSHPGFQLHLDAAGMTLSEEDVEKSLQKAFPYLKHFHISEPQLNMVQNGKVNHKQIARVLHDINYTNYVSIEMKSGINHSNIETVRSCLSFVQSVYN
ncbi:sugar phosphate isomerase/epimerase family protein [Bacillus sp. T33-2]|uniref:sugar phosphate isomerase/epimerase family protein n=1 Tax=Bacillus sp. T33-2 TaxID=2054168 RepID=UPI000C77E534|nr:sugar phosphate isomerase/epimerase family protein [Bacillus sp. T33-2]PLR90770.1 sugar phosphate isomerase/epimerase [Bacillus sp. T33-2]